MNIDIEVLRVYTAEGQDGFDTVSFRIGAEHYSEPRDAETGEIDPGAYESECSAWAFDMQAAVKAEIERLAAEWLKAQ